MNHLKIYEQFDKSDPFGEESKEGSNLKIVSTEYGLLLIIIDPNVEVVGGKECGISIYDTKFLGEKMKDCPKQTVFVKDDNPRIFPWDRILFFENRYDDQMSKIVQIEYNHLPHNIKEKIVNL